MSDELADHVEEYHAFKASELMKMVIEHKELLTDVSGLKKDTALSVELLAGKQIIDPYTGQPTGERLPGIASRVETLEYDANGGSGIHIRFRDKAQMGLWGVLGAVVTSLGLILAAWVSQGG
jgi:hypothetical protein